MAGDLHAQMASGEVGAQRLHGAVRPARPRRHRGARRRDHRAAPRRPPAPASASCPAGTAPTPAPLLDLADGSRIDIVCALTVDPEARRDHRRLHRLLRRQPVGHQRRQELHPRLHDVHGALGAQPGHPQQPRQPGADQGRSPRKARSSTPSRRSRARPATSSGCSCPTRCSRRSPRSRPSRRWPRGRARCGRCRSAATDDDGSPFITAMFTYAGGVGARAGKPGLDACSYPTGVAAVPIEVVEASAPIRFTHQGAAARLRRRRRDRPAGSARRSSSRVDTDPAVAAQRRDEPAGRGARRASSAASRARPAGSASTARPSPPRPASPCSPTTSCASTSRAAAATASRED